MQIASSSRIVEARLRYSAVDLTDFARHHVERWGPSDGFLLTFCLHTTCALIVNEWENGVLEDFGRALEKLVPASAYYVHDDFEIRTQNLVVGERANGAAHVAQMIMGGASQVIPIAGRDLVLGTWQRLILWELDEPKPRTITFHTFGGESATQSLVTNNQNARPA